jgi:hypothetical protein
VIAFSGSFQSAPNNPIPSKLRFFTIEIFVSSTPPTANNLVVSRES